MSSMESNAFEMCDDVIDLRALMLTLWQGKWHIIIATLAAAAAALVLSLLMPKQYEASLSLVVAQPKIQIAGANGLGLKVNTPDMKSVVALARSPALFQALAEDEDIQAAWQQEANTTPLTWQALAHRAKVNETGKDGLQLTFQDTNPQRAAHIVDRWAALVARQINQNYGFATVVQQIDASVQAAQEDYQRAEAAYFQLLAQNQQATLEARLVRAKSDLRCVLARMSDIERLQADIETFETYLQALPQDAPLASGDALALMTLQQRALAAKVCAEDAAEMQVQWPMENVATLTVGEATAAAKRLQQALRQRAQSLPSQQEALERQILQWQQALEEVERQLAEAKSQRDAAWSVYQSLAQLQMQGKALSLSGNQIALISGRAAVPAEPVSPRVLANVALAAVAGGMLGVLGVFVVGWWER